jgi:hypothetical protein
MAAGMNLLSRLWNVWRRLRRRNRFTRVVMVDSMDSLPKRLGSSLYVVGGAHPKWVVVSCPCGCGERIDVNLMRTRRPTWQLSLESDQVSLHPSLWVPKERCGSHFIVRKNRIDWV